MICTIIHYSIVIAVNTFRSTAKLKISRVCLLLTILRQSYAEDRDLLFL